MLLLQIVPEVLDCHRMVEDGTAGARTGVVEVNQVDFEVLDGESQHLLDVVAVSGVGK